MAWQIEFSPSVDKDLANIGHDPARRILRFLQERVANHDDPRSIGEALKGSRLGDFWRYRVGDYRVIVDVQDNPPVVSVLKIGHRREIYRRR